MKERPDPNYLLRVRPVEPEVEVQLPGAAYVEVNVAIRLVLVPRLPSAWPPRYLEPEDIRDAEDAARYLLATTLIAVAPHEAADASVETYVDPELPETQHTLFRLPRAGYDALADDVARVEGEFARLDDLGDRPLAAFLRQDLPRAVLDAEHRRLLCLPP